VVKEGGGEGRGRGGGRMRGGEGKVGGEGDGSGILGVGPGVRKKGAWGVGL